MYDHDKIAIIQLKMEKPVIAENITSRKLIAKTAKPNRGIHDTCALSLLIPEAEQATNNSKEAKKNKVIRELKP